jgi:hypothetical protein
LHARAFHITRNIKLLARSILTQKWTKRPITKTRKNESTKKDTVTHDQTQQGQSFFVLSPFRVFVIQFQHVGNSDTTSVFAQFSRILNEFALLFVSERPKIFAMSSGLLILLPLLLLALVGARV